MLGVLEQLEALGLELPEVRQIRAAPESPPTTEPRALDGRRSGSLRATTVTQPEPDEYELYDLTLDPTEEHNLAHPSNADERSRTLQQTMLGLLNEQLAAKRLTPSAGERPGYRPPPPA